MFMRLYRYFRDHLPFVAWLLVQLRDPRFWVGASTVCGALGINLDPGLGQSVMIIATAVTTLISYFTAQQKVREMKEVQRGLGVKPDGWAGPETVGVAKAAEVPVTHNAQGGA